MKKLMLLVGAMSASMVWAAPTSEFVSYRYYDASSKTFKSASADCTVVTSATREFSDGGWYAVTEDVTITDANITVNGSAHLILCDGATLTVTNVPNWYAAVDVSVVDGVTNSLSIYGQTDGTGGLNVLGSDCAAGIGGGYYGAGGTVTINGGMVTAIGGGGGSGIGGGCYGAGGTVTINGGAVTATGGEWGAGIGGGSDGAGGTVTINGGVVTAIGGEWGAGIGGGSDGAGGTVTIDCGMVMVMGGESAAGIGGGNCGAGGSVMINGGSVTAMAGVAATGIGGGYAGAGGVVTINGGNVTAIGSDVGCAGIGGGVRTAAVGSITFCDDGTVEFGENVGDDILAGANVVHSAIVTKEAYAQGHHATYVTMPAAVARVPQVAGITYSVSNGTGEVTGTLANCTNTYLVAPGDSLTVYFILNPGCEYTKSTNPIVISGIRGERTVDLTDLPAARLPTIDYEDWNGNGRVAASTDSYMEYRGDVELSAGMIYVVKESRVAPDHIKVNGTAENPTRLVLCDGVTLSATNGVEVNADGTTTNALIICGQSGDTGKLVATGGEFAAGIGGGDAHSCGIVTIVGGEISATGGYLAAGIGGGFYGAGGLVTIRSGKVTAHGGDDGEDVGHGSCADGSGLVAISGGLFWDGLQDKWIAAGYAKVKNTDAETKEQYPYAVVPDVVPTPLMPGQGSKPYETREEAEAAAAVTEVLPAEGFGLTGDALVRWQGYFVNQVYVGGDGKFRIVPELNADGSNALAQAEAKLTRAIDIGAIAAATGAIEEMVLEGAEPGFYYTLFKSADVTVVLEQENHDPGNCDRKALSDGKVTFKNVTKPSDAAGFFTVRAFVKESFTMPLGM